MGRMKELSEIQQVILFLILAGLMCVQTASGDYQLTVKIIKNPWITTQRQKKVVRTCLTEITRETGVSLRTSFHLVAKNPCKVRACKGDPWCAMDQSFQCFKYEFVPNGRLRYVVAPPYKMVAGRFFIGCTNGVCLQQGLAMSSMQTLRSDGLPGEYVSQVGCMHEIGHLLGARHHSDFDGTQIDIMNPNAFYYASLGSLSFNRYQRLVSIPMCIKTWKKGK